MLSVLRPGEMIRFILLPVRGRKVRFEIEGAELGEVPALLAERLGLILKAMHGRGYVFVPTSAGGEKKRNIALRALGDLKKPAGRWVSVRPRVLQTNPTHVQALGFGAVPLQELPDYEIRLPDLPVSSGPSLFKYLANLFVDVPQVKAFEIEFTRSCLPPDWVKPLERVLQLHMLVASERSTGTGGNPSLLQHFLALWLSQMGGWDIRVRARITARGGIPNRRSRDHGP